MRDVPAYLPVVWRQASGIPPFFVAFCVTPFASNASELVSSLKFAAAKRRAQNPVSVPSDFCCSFSAA